MQQIISDDKNFGPLQEKILANIQNKKKTKET